MLEIFNAKRGTCAALALLGALAAAAGPARAEYPDHPITGIIPFTVGGVSDTTGRLVAQGISKALGQTVVVENKGGAGGNAGIEIASLAKPDGYTILMSSIAMTINPALYRNLLWDPKNIQPVALVETTQSAVAVNAKKFPTGNLKDLIAAIKANPGKFNFATSDSALYENLFQVVTGTKIEMVNYSGSGDGTTALQSGEADVELTGTTALIPALPGGKIRILAVTGDSRVDALPDVPTTTEAGLPQYSPTGYYGVYVPAGTPDDIVERINKAVNATVDTPEFSERIKSLGASPRHSTVRQAADFFPAEMARWKDIAAKTHIPPLD